MDIGDHPSNAIRGYQFSASRILSDDHKTVWSLAEDVATNPLFDLDLHDQHAFVQPVSFVVDVLYLVVQKSCDIRNHVQSQ